MKYYVIKGQDTRKGEKNMKGYFTSIEEIRGQIVIGFSSTIDYRGVRKYKTKKRCEIMLKKLSEGEKNYIYTIEEIERN